MDAEIGRNHVCKAGLCNNKRILRRNHEKAYTKRLLSNVELFRKFEEAESTGDIGKLAFCVRLLIVQAARDRAVVMTSLAKCAFVHARKQKGPLSPIWFDEPCRLKRRMFIEAVKRVEAKHACHILRQESARCNCVTKRCHKGLQCALDLGRLFKKDPQDHATEEADFTHRSSSNSGMEPQFAVTFKRNQQCHNRIGVNILLGF
eukprot:scaffold80806_cov17-Tisochrysis_lutea.AAC.1